MELDGVDEADGEFLGLGVEAGELALLGVGVELGGLGGGAFLEGVGVDGGDFGGGGEGHRGEGGAFGGLAGGLAGGDFGRGFEHGGNGAEVRQGAGGDVATVEGAAAGGEGAARDPEVIDLVEMADVEGEPGDGLAEGAGERGLGGERVRDIAGFLEENVEEAGRHRVIELRGMIGGDEAGGGELFQGVARGGEGADDGAEGIGEATVGHICRCCFDLSGTLAISGMVGRIKVGNRAECRGAGGRGISMGKRG